MRKMLPVRSISPLHISVLLLLILNVVKCQYYNPDYSVHDDLGSSDHSNYGSDSSGPDYSKYYNNDGTSGALIGTQFLNEGSDKGSESGFVTPLDFTGFFGASQFGAASKQESSLPAIPVGNPFQFHDAFKKQNSSGFVDSQDFAASFSNAPNFELDIGQHFSNGDFEPKTNQAFTSPKVSSYKSAPKNKKSQSFTSEVDDLNGYETPTKYSQPLKKSNYEANLDYTNPKSDYPDVTSHYNSYNPGSAGLSSYSTGRKSHLTPIKTYVPHTIPTSKYSNLPLTASLPNYQKYNFQPVSSSANLNINPSYNIPSTSGNYYSPSEYAQPSEYKSKKVQNAQCQKIDKQLSADDISHGRFRRQAERMNCFLCKNPKTGGTYEKCSYTSNPDDDNSYFRGHAEKYSTKTYVDPDEHSRERRDLRRNNRRYKQKRDDKEDEAEEYVNPFNYEKENAHKFHSKPEEFDDSESYYKAPDFGQYEKDIENYRFGPEYFTDASNEEKSSSEIQSEQLKKSGENCRKVKKDSMICMVCSNPKTGGNYEQCSYTSEPQEKKYAYVNERKYDSSNPSGEEKSVESTESKPTVERNKSHYKSSPYYSASTKHPQKINKNLKSFDAESENSKETIRDQSQETEEYAYDKYFPKYTDENPKKEEVKPKSGYQYSSDIPEYFTAQETKKDVDTVLQEFTKKDRSKCKKVTKDKMTCYSCVDDKGVQHEECMFVSESQPKSSHIAYHEVKEFTTDPKKKQKEAVAAEAQQTTQVRSAPSAIMDVDVEPAEYVKVINGKKPRIVRRRTNLSKDYLPQESRQSEIQVDYPRSAPSTDERRVKQLQGADGAYATELRPIFSKQFGVTLPAYMLDVSEGEKIFEEVAKNVR